MAHSLGLNASAGFHFYAWFPVGIKATVEAAILLSLESAASTPSAARMAKDKGEKGEQEPELEVVTEHQQQQHEEKEEEPPFSSGSTKR